MRHVPIIRLGLITLLWSTGSLLLDSEARANPIIYVNASATGGEDGSSWADAFTDLQDALALAQTMEGDRQIWVAAGVYQPTQSSDPTVSFVLQKDLGLFGGFDGTETALEERDWNVNQTVLTGQIGGGARSYHVVTGSEVTGSRLSGFFIQDGRASNTGTSPLLGRGGGVAISSGALHLDNLVVRDNFAGNCCQGSGYGGGMHIVGGTHVLHSVSFESNTARGYDHARGGGLYAQNATLELRYVDFISNGAVSYFWAEGGGLYHSGGDIDYRSGIFVQQSVTGETGPGRGGGARILSSNALLFDIDIVQTKCWWGVSGCGIYFSGGSIMLANLRLTGNGGMSNSTIATSGTATMVNGLLAGSWAEGAVYLWGVEGGSATVINSTFVLAEPHDILHTDEDFAFLNSIAWSSNDPVTFGSETVTVSHSIVRGGSDGTAVIDADPLFLREPSPGADGQWGTTQDDYGDLRLQEGSPAIDFGLTAHLPPDTYDVDGDGDTSEPFPIDLAGAPRIQGAEVDLGAYEGAFPVSDEPPPVATLDRLGVYPNPVRTRATVILSVATEQNQVRVELVDVLGRRVRVVHDGPIAAGNTDLVLDARSLPAGLYFLRVIGDDLRLPATTLMIVR